MSRTDREQRLDEVVTAYLRAGENGEPANPAAWLARYPDLAGELTEFFADQRHVERVAAPLRGLVPCEPTAGTPSPGSPGTPQLEPRSPPDYEILGEIARGGMGVVYRARQKRLRRLVALKMILAGAHAGESERARFRTEAEAIARLQHSHIVQIFEVGEHDGLPYLALEHCPGGTLEAKLAGAPPPAPAAPAPLPA